MADLSYLCNKNCCCCNVRLNSTKKSNIRSINNIEFLNKVNNVLPTIIKNKKLTTNKTNVNIGHINIYRVYLGRVF
jgi:hypothetical protein